MSGHAPEYADTVVVGSGFGGAVAAYRLAEAGQSVVVLERGRAYPPGSFGRTPDQAADVFWDPRAGRHGIYDMWSFRGLDALVASGLGGGSLLFANVLLRKDEHWFADHQPLPGGGYEHWPVTRAELEPHYDAVERMIGATPYPLDHPQYADTPKTHALRDAAHALGLEFRLPPLAISFAPAPGAAPAPGVRLAEARYGNLHGVERRTCRLCGECNFGCNDGAKNSLDHTYLSAAAALGADLRTHHEVRTVRPLPGGGYRVDYLVHRPEDPAAPLRRGSIISARLVLAAGTLGTTQLLLASRRHLPGLGPGLGRRFSANGDHFGFCVRPRQESRERPLRPERGPVITGAVRLPDALDGTGHDPSARGGYIEDGGYPQFVQWMVESARGPQFMGRAGQFTLRQLLGRAGGAAPGRISADIAGLFGEGLPHSSTMMLLGMGRDQPSGTLRLRDGRLDAAWSTAANTAYFDRMRTAMRQLAEEMGGRYVDNALWHATNRAVTVHPCGGAAMAADPQRGVCDPYGEVHGHPGLYIADGAALPGPVGANPSFTIAALSDRMCDHLIDSAAAPARAAAPAPAPRSPRTSLQFTEEMRGGYRRGPGGPPEPLAFRVTVTVDDLYAFLDDPDHEARADGWIEAPGLGGRRPVGSGLVRLFTPHGPGRTSTLRYLLHFHDDGGRPLTLCGTKQLTGGAPLRLWRETTTLRVRLLAGHTAEPDSPPPDSPPPDSPPLGTGVLRLGFSDLLRQLTTLRTTGPAGAAALTRFTGFFLRRLRHTYAPLR